MVSTTTPRPQAGMLSTSKPLPAPVDAFYGQPYTPPRSPPRSQPIAASRSLPPAQPQYSSTALPPSPPVEDFNRYAQPTGPRAPDARRTLSAPVDARQPLRQPVNPYRPATAESPNKMSRWVNKLFGSPTPSPSKKVRNRLTKSEFAATAMRASIEEQHRRHRHSTSQQLPDRRHQYPEHARHAPSASVPARHRPQHSPQRSRESSPSRQPASSPYALNSHRASQPPHAAMMQNPRAAPQPGPQADAYQSSYTSQRTYPNGYISRSGAQDAYTERQQRDDGHQSSGRHSPKPSPQHRAQPSFSTTASASQPYAMDAMHRYSASMPSPNQMRTAENRPLPLANGHASHTSSPLAPYPPSQGHSSQGHSSHGHAPDRSPVQGYPQHQYSASTQHPSSGYAFAASTRPNQSPTPRHLSTFEAYHRSTPSQTPPVVARPHDADRRATVLLPNDHPHADSLDDASNGWAHRASTSLTTPQTSPTRQKRTSSLSPVLQQQAYAKYAHHQQQQAGPSILQPPRASGDTGRSSGEASGSGSGSGSGGRPSGERDGLTPSRSVHFPGGRAPQDRRRPATAPQSHPQRAKEDAAATAPQKSFGELSSFAPPEPSRLDGISLRDIEGPDAVPAGMVVIPKGVQRIIGSMRRKGSYRRTVQGPGTRWKRRSAGIDLDRRRSVMSVDGGTAGDDWAI